MKLAKELSRVSSEAVDTWNVGEKNAHSPASVIPTVHLTQRDGTGGRVNEPRIWVLRGDFV
jgi:hypothetical protein